MRASRTLEHWRDDIRRWGWLRFLHIRLMRSLSRYVSICGVYSRPLDHFVALPELPAGLEFRLASKEDLDRACDQPALKLSNDWVHDALARGDLCVASFEGDRMIGYSWLSFTTAPHLHGLWAHFEKPYRYGYNSFVLPEFRGCRLSAYMGNHMNRYCLDQGFEQTIAFIECHNYASMASTRRRGGRRVGWAGYVRIFGRLWPFRSPGARRHRFGFFPYPKPIEDARTLPVSWEWR